MRRPPGEARLLGLWTAGWLGVLLLAGLLWIGDLAVQWPVLLVPVGWALVAVRPRRRAVREADPRDWPHTGREPFPPTREAPTLPRVPRERPHREW
jgi:hypothetical protein